MPDHSARKAQRSRFHALIGKQVAILQISGVAHDIYTVGSIQAKTEDQELWFVHLHQIHQVQLAVHYHKQSIV